MKLHKVEVHGEFKNSDRKLENYSTVFYVETLEAVMAQVKKLATEYLTRKMPNYAGIVTHYIKSIDDQEHQGSGSEVVVSYSNMPVSKLIMLAELNAGIPSAVAATMSKDDIIAALSKASGVAAQPEAVSPPVVKAEPQQPKMDAVDQPPAILKNKGGRPKKPQAKDLPPKKEPIGTILNREEW